MADPRHDFARALKRKGFDATQISQVIAAASESGFGSTAKPAAAGKPTLPPATAQRSTTPPVAVPTDRIAKLKAARARLGVVGLQGSNR